MRLFAALLSFVACAASNPTFQHSWDGSISSMAWVDFAFRLGLAPGAPNLTKTQADFVANNYAIVSLEKCLAEPENETLTVFRDWSRNLKAINPDLKILFYWNMKENQVSCYGSDIQEIGKHPEWWATTDEGTPVPVTGGNHYNNDSSGLAPYWVDIAASQSDYVDGYFVDSAGAPLWQGVSDERRAAAATGSKAKLDLLRAAVPDKVVIGNTLNAYPQVPNFDMDFLPHLDGACAEHVASFEQVLRGTNSLNTTMTAGLLTRMWQTADQMNKTVLARTWPGPVTTPINGLGPSWHLNNPFTAAERVAAAEEWVEWAVALFLTVATDRTYLSYDWWYTADSGVYPCPSGECLAPTKWYPIMSNKPGAPLGPALRLDSVGGRVIGEIGSKEDLAETAAAIQQDRQAAGVYTRQFQHAHVSVDLGTMSANVTWTG